MSLLQETKEIQSKMALFCRTGNFVELPGITPNRLHHYRRLIYNIFEENLESSFPISFEYIENKKWQEMLNEFFGHHNCQSYQVWQVPGEFYAYAEKNNFASKYQIPYLTDLLRFEWEEMVVYNMEDIPFPENKNQGDLLNDLLAVNPEFKLLQLEYPVHTHNPIEACSLKGSYFVLLYRESETGKVQFIDLSVWYALIIEQITTQDVTVQNLINEAPKFFGELKMNDFTKKTLLFLEELRTRKLIIGFKK